MQSGATHRLVVRRGPQPNQQFLLTRDTVTIGRDITNDIVINDPEVSRHHARLIRTPNGYTYEDLRSTNGSFINRQRITAPYQMTNGDMLGLGETITLAYEVVGDIAAATMVASGGSSEPAPAPMAAPRAAQPVAPMAADDDDSQPDRNRWLVIGCGALALLFCCALVIGAIVVDQANLYCSLPVLSSLFACP
jgi:hypothetical protein